MTDIGFVEEDGRLGTVFVFDSYALDVLLKTCAFFVVLVTLCVFGFHYYLAVKPVPIGVFGYETVLNQVSDEFEGRYNSDHMKRLNVIQAIKRSDVVLDDLMVSEGLSMILDDRFVKIDNLSDYEVINLNDVLVKELVALHLYERGGDK